jgi:hypothetical protein
MLGPSEAPVAGRAGASFFSAILPRTLTRRLRAAWDESTGVDLASSRLAWPRTFAKRALQAAHLARF